MKKLTGYIFMNEFADIILVLNERPDLVWIPTREGKKISVEKRARGDVEAWAARKSVVKVIHDPHE